jgi:peptidoglycan/LPS O-acetylase OafA/YrhL
MIYLKGLNGIRAIAAIAVVISHITLSLPMFELSPYVFGSKSDGSPETLNLAGYGVSMFFGLSGFLITYLLCKEKEKAGQINIKKFYLRRILRIWPLYYAYLLLCFIIYWWYNIDFETDSIYFYLFYTANIPFILGSTLPFLAHYWSLGVEEQFYIFWPWLNKFSIEILFKISLSLAVIIVSLKAVLHIYFPASMLELIIHVSRFHCMLFGAISAILYYQRNGLFLKTITSFYTQIVCWICLFLVAFNKFHIASFLDNEFITLVTCCIIIGQITNTGLLSLENKYFDFLGKVSYGIYVIHPLIIYLYSKYYLGMLPYSFLNYLSVYMVVVSVTILISYLSYTYFEKPFLQLKSKKYSVIKSVSSKNSLIEKRFKKG